MIKLEFIRWSNYLVFIWISLSLFLNAFVAYLWKIEFYRKFGLKKYQAIQRIHLNETPRLGGLIYIICLAGFAKEILNDENNKLLDFVLLSMMPVMLLSLKEDLFHNVKPSIRLLGIFCSAAIFVIFNISPLPNLENVPFISNLYNFTNGIIFFYIIGLVALANGMNLTDGVNGLCSLIALSCLGAILFLAFKNNDLLIAPLALANILLLLPFVAINYPFGKIFLGDFGAYSLGLLIGILTIIFFGRHPETIVWNAILILIYPLTELVFSILRRIISGISVLEPDSHHLHLKLFYFFKSSSSYNKFANALVAPSLSVLWLFPLVTLPWVYQKPLFIFIAIIFFVSLYCFLYTVLTNNIKKYAQ